MPKHDLGNQVLVFNRVRAWDHRCPGIIYAVAQPFLPGGGLAEEGVDIGDGSLCGVGPNYDDGCKGLSSRDTPRIGVCKS